VAGILSGMRRVRCLREQREGFSTPPNRPAICPVSVTGSVFAYQDDGTAATIHAMLPRKTFLQRKYAGKKIELQMIAANIDVAFIVQSCHYDFNVSRLERYLVMANEGRVEPLLILSKTDLIDADRLTQLVAEIRSAGIKTRVIAISNVTGAGVDQLEEFMERGKTYCFVGSSGVGKSTLINRITGQDSLKTRPVSESGEGRHTTVRRQLLVLDQGAMLIDTPGMREVGLLGAGDGVDDNFEDILELSLDCRFSNCRHSNEPGCAIVKAMEDGELQQEHYENYLKLKAESESNEISYGAKRKRKKHFEKLFSLCCYRIADGFHRKVRASQGGKIQLSEWMAEEKGRCSYGDSAACLIKRINLSFVVHGEG